jgi:FkbM family methyltransferase
MLLDFNTIYEQYLLNLRGVIHIGAHYGQEHSMYIQKGVTNIIYFEPLEKNFEVLKRNVKDDSVCYKMALGNENKRIKMFVESANNGMSSSILEPKDHLLQYPHIVFNHQEEVDMRKLDDIEFNRLNYNMINIDVQGYELEVFKGAEKTLNHIDYIIAEINNVHLYKNGALLEDLIQFLSPYGFKLVESNWAGVTWGDGLFIKK